jgi:hypothetical protein
MKRRYLGFLFWLLFQSSSSLYAAAMALNNESELISRYEQFFNDLNQINTNHFFTSRRCISQPSTGDQSFCDDPMVYINQADRILDPTGVTIRSRLEVLQQAQELSVSAYQDKVEELMNQVMASDDEPSRAIREARDRAFANNPRANECSAKLVILGAYDFMVDEIDDFREGGACQTSLEALNALSSNSDLKDVSKKIQESMLENLHQSDFFQTVQNEVFTDVKNIFEREIINEITDPEQRERARGIISRISYNQESCTERYGLTQSQAHLSGREVCLSTLFLQSSTSLYQIVHTLGHELGHALDSCSNFCKGNEESYPFNHQIEVTAARVNLDSDNGSCLRGDQAVLRELMSDNFATEITFHYFKDSNFSSEDHRRGFSSVFLNLRDSEDQGYDDNSSHPFNRDRYNMMLSHPGVRNQIRCEGGDFELFQ